MTFKVVVMPHGRFEGVSGMLVTDPADSKYGTPCIETLGLRYYPDDVLWVYAWNKAARDAAIEAGYRV
ncbi:MAG: hypothetical protein IH971_04500 [Candidatus Marinimicrobia bacterium]|nr:hypothetical protein [Candidatus Neomarinimicrobiota bacterium]